MDQQFFNDGLIELRCEHVSGRSPTLVVSGVARGGTSMVAKLLYRAGIPMGDRHDLIVYEDVDLAAALAEPDRATLRALVAARNSIHPVWGFKRPELHTLFRPCDLTVFREPRLILVLRDPVAVARRNVVSMRSQPEQGLQSAVTALREAVDFATSIRWPTLLVSYEKAILQPAGFVERLLRFCGVAQPPEICDELALAITSEPAEYRQATHL